MPHCVAGVVVDAGDHSGQPRAHFPKQVEYTGVAVAGGAGARAM